MTGETVAPRLLAFENEAWESGAEWVAGVDEAGRGCLAGPVFAAACAATSLHRFPPVRDSKALNEQQRERLYAEIARSRLVWAVASASVEEIERLNIYQATILAMKRALAKLGIVPSIVLVDGMKLPGLELPQLKVVKGDAKCATIAAASILAKVSRDRYMCRLDEYYPGYGFAQHKGYGTADHKSALRELGPCPAHRSTFKPVEECLLGTLEV